MTGGGAFARNISSSGIIVAALLGDGSGACDASRRTTQQGLCACADAGAQASAGMIGCMGKVITFCCVF
ncbi:MAG: hypothetical protein EOM12_13130 [Verrucomicrobiae bacterium]|nr:hypothetical protein [Verrucomicrobiae bacterium]